MAVQLSFPFVEGMEIDDDVTEHTHRLLIASRLVRLVDLADIAQTILDAISDDLSMSVDERREFMSTVTSDKLLNGCAEVYADYFTASELRDLELFYASGAGKKLVENTPEIMQQCMKIGEQFALSVHSKEVAKRN